MRAVVVSRPGGPEVLELVKRPVPEPTPGEVSIRPIGPGTPERMPTEPRRPRARSVATVETAR